MGEADAVFLSLFSSDVEASMLACDEAGIVPDELLYLPKAIFFAGVESEEQGLIRYNMRERFRQGMFRKVFGLKKAIMLKGNVAARWRERNYIFPDAPMPPDLTAIRRKDKLDDSGNVVGEEDVGELDTESDDDGLDEYFRPKPPPAAPAANATAAAATSTSASPAGVVPFLRSWGPSGGGGSAMSSNAVVIGRGVPPGPSSPSAGTSVLIAGSRSLTSRSRKNVEPPPPPPPPIPHLPREPPRCRTLTARNLKRELQNLEVSRMRLARYGSKVDKVVTMTVERESSRSPPRQRTLTSQPPASVSPTASTSSLFPRIPLAAREAKRQLSAVVRQTMMGIAESAIHFNAYREDLLDREDEELETSAARSGRRATAAALSREMWFAQAEARKQREEEQRTAEALLAQEYQRYTMEKQHRMQHVLSAKHHAALLSTEVLRMKQLFAQEKRECMVRREETRVQRVVARSEPKHQHAEFVLMQRKLEAESSRQQHIQLELLRKELKDTLNRMNAKNDWEMPPLLEDLIVTSQRRRSSELGITPPSGDNSRSGTAVIH